MKSQRILEFRWVFHVLFFLIVISSTTTVKAFSRSAAPSTRRTSLTTSNGMTWSDTWNDILNGGPKRWKIDDLYVKQQALQYLVEAHRSSSNTKKKSADADDGMDDRVRLNIFCPLAGDDPFVQYAWSQGHSVTSMDIVPEAVQVMRRQFSDKPDSDDDSEWTCESRQEQQEMGVGDSAATTTRTTKIWRHKSGRATLYEGDMLQGAHSELVGQFSAIYDKDAFGAMEKALRPVYCQRLAEYAQGNAAVYIEVKRKENAAARLVGPPFHVEKDDLMDPTSFGTHFQYEKNFGEVVALVGMPGLSQTAHLLRRLV